MKEESFRTHRPNEQTWSKADLMTSGFWAKKRGHAQDVGEEIFVENACLLNQTKGAECC